MKYNYKYEMHPTLPSDAKILKHKDFDALLRQHRLEKYPKNTVVRWLTIGGSIAAGIVGIYFYFQFATPDFQSKQDKFFANQPYVNPPLSIKPTYYSEKFDSRKGITFKSKSGSKYTLPANALKHENGKPTTGEVTLHYREMHDFVDFFIAGVPMTYDSAGRQWQFESAGMVEIFAEQDGKKLHLDPENPIQVELISEIPAKNEAALPKFNIYKLEIEKRQWVYACVDNLQLLDNQNLGTAKFSDKTAEIARLEQRAIQQIEQSLPVPTAPVKPQRANGNSFVFNLDFKASDFLTNSNASNEESAQLFRKYKGALWQVKPSEAITSAQLKKRWDDAKIRPVSERDFELTLASGQEKIQVTVNPVLSGDAFSKALTDYQNELIAYQKQLADREETLAPKIAAVKNKFEQERAATVSGEEVVADTDDDVGRVKVINRFSVNSFGIWNCDRPYLPEGEAVAGNFVDEKEHQFDNLTAYLVDKDKNTLMRFYATEGTQLKLRDKSEHLLWLVTSDNQIAVLRPEDLEKMQLKTSSDDNTFVMDVVEQRIDNEADIRRILTF